MIVNVIISFCTEINTWIIMKTLNKYDLIKLVEVPISPMESLHQMHMYHFCILYCMAMFLDLKEKEKPLLIILILYIKTIYITI